MNDKVQTRAIFAVEAKGRNRIAEMARFIRQKDQAMEKVAQEKAKRRSNRRATKATLNGLPKINEEPEDDNDDILFASSSAGSMSNFSQETQRNTV